MASLFLDMLQNIFGEGFKHDWFVEEALCISEDVNRSLAVIGDCILNLAVNEKAYSRNKSPDYLDRVRKLLADKEANKAILNNDTEFVEFLCTENFDMGTQGEIGKEKADRFVEALIGAVYLSKGFNDAVRFAQSILESNPDYREEFPESDFEIWVRGDLKPFDADCGSLSVEELVYALFDELESMKPDILDALRWLKDRKLTHFHEVELWCTDKYEFFESAKLEICLLEGDQLSLHLYTNVFNIDPIFVLPSERYLEHLSQTLSMKIYGTGFQKIWKEDTNMHVWYSPPK